MLRRYLKKLVLAIVLSASLTFTACTPYEEDLFAAGTAGYVLGSYSYPRYTHRPYYHYNNRYYYGGAYRNGHYYYRGRRLAHGHYYAHPHYHPRPYVNARPHRYDYRQNRRPYSNRHHTHYYRPNSVAPRHTNRYHQQPIRGNHPNRPYIKDRDNPRVHGNYNNRIHHPRPFSGPEDTNNRRRRD